MEQSKFYKTLQKLNKQQQLRFLDFLQSPYFNKNEEITGFVKLICPGKFNVSKEEIYSKLYPGKIFEERRIPDLMYKSLRLMETFLSEEQYTEQQWNQKLNLLNYIRVNQLEELYSVVQKDILEMSSQKPYRDSNYYYEEFQYQAEADKIFLDQARIQGDESLQKKVDQLDIFYLSAKLRDSCEMMNRKRILAIDYEFNMLDELLEIVKLNFEKYTVIPSISIYYRILVMLKDPNNMEHFNVLKDDVTKHIQLFEQDEQRSLYGYLQNYCIRKVNSGVSKFYNELLDIYKYMHEIGLMKANNKNLQWDLKNMVSIALRLGDHEWTYKIINELKPELPGEVRENAYTYNLANYYYETREYKKATRLLQSVDFKDVYYNLDSKSMLLKIYFELDEEESFFALITTFKAYLSRNKLISTDTFDTYSNLLKFARKAFVYKIMLPYERRHNNNKIKALKQTVIETKNVVNAIWLLNEIEKLFENEPIRQ